MLSRAAALLMIFAESRARVSMRLPGGSGIGDDKEGSLVSATPRRGHELSSQLRATHYVSD